MAIYSLPPEVPLSQIERDMIEKYLANKKETESINKTSVTLKLKNMSIEELMKLTGYSKNYCYRILRGDDKIPAKLINKLEELDK